MRRALDFAQQRQRFLRLCRKDAVAVHDVEHLVAGGFELAADAPERRRADVVAARVDEHVRVLHAEDRVDLRRKHRGVERRVCKDGRDELHAVPLEKSAVFRGAEVRVDDVHIDDDAAPPLCSRLDREVQREVRFSAAVMPADHRNPAVHPFTPFLKFPRGHSGACTL